MKTLRSGAVNRGFSLLELLCVIAIIAILAALLLPVLNRTRGGARRAECISHLRQLGIGFQTFAHDHNGLFPMAVASNSGGSLEFAQSAYRLQGLFYFGFRHFQAISNEIVTPKVVICPSDTRVPATIFRDLKNENVSYFVGINAEYAHPNSLLAGDRNLTNDYVIPSTLVRLGGNYVFHWTSELHQYKGNLLFADGRVEERNSLKLTNPDQSPATADLVLPTPLKSGSRLAVLGPGLGSPRGSSGGLSAPGGQAAPAYGSPTNKAGPSNSISSVALATKAQALPGSTLTQGTTPLAPQKESGPADPPPIVIRVGDTSSLPVETSIVSSVSNSPTLAVSEPASRKNSWPLYLLLLLILIVAGIRVASRIRANHGDALE